MEIGFKTSSRENDSKTENAGGGLILGIDPGFTGACALIRPAPVYGGVATLIDVIDMPIIKPSVFSKKPRPDIDAVKLAAWVRAYAHKITLACVEKVSAAPGQGVVSMFRFGEGFGIVQGVLASFDLKVLKPVPAVWKASMNLNRNKTRSIEAAKVVEGAAQKITLMKHHGRAEAVLLALYGARSLGGRLDKAPSATAQFPRGGDIHDLF